MAATDAPARQLRRGRAAAGTPVVVALVAVLVAFAWHEIRDAAAGPDASAPSCSWPAHIEQANSDQTGLIRCYLRALAHHSPSEMRAVARSKDDNGPTGFSAADFAHTADARSGIATVIVEDSDVDGADAAVSIRYANGAHDEQEIHLANPSSWHSWRFWDIGTYPRDPDAPPPVRP